MIRTPDDTDSDPGTVAVFFFAVVVGSDSAPAQAAKATLRVAVALEPRPLAEVYAAGTLAATFAKASTSNSSWALGEIFLLNLVGGRIL